MHFWLISGELSQRKQDWGRLSPLVCAQDKKIFTVQGQYPTIRRLLRARGWVERRLSGTGRQLEQHRGNQNKQQLEKGPSNDGSRQGEALLNPRCGARPRSGTPEPLHNPWLPPDEEEEKEEEQCDEDSDGLHDLMVS